jgi:DNA-binding YbaB/EbfC family protein
MANTFDLGGLLKQAQALQERLASAQDELAKRSVEGTAGGGMVTAVVNGRLEVMSVRIDPTLLVEPDRDMLQDLVVAAVNAAIHAAQRMMGEEMGRLSGGLGIKLPGMG